MGPVFSPLVTWYEISKEKGESKKFILKQILQITIFGIIIGTISYAIKRDIQLALRLFFFIFIGAIFVVFAAIWSYPKE